MKPQETIQTLIIDGNDWNTGQLKKLNYVMIYFSYNETKILDFTILSDIFKYIKYDPTKTSLFDWMCEEGIIDYSQDKPQCGWDGLVEYLNLFNLYLTHFEQSNISLFMPVDVSIFSALLNQIEQNVFADF